MKTENQMRINAHGYELVRSSFTSEPTDHVQGLGQLVLEVQSVPQSTKRSLTIPIEEYSAVSVRYSQNVRYVEIRIVGSTTLRDC